jgi:hypothetical protein
MEENDDHDDDSSTPSTPVMMVELLSDIYFLKADAMSI